jgi:hypothetical protein
LSAIPAGDEYRHRRPHAYSPRETVGADGMVGKRGRFSVIGRSSGDVAVRHARTVLQRHSTRE